MCNFAITSKYGYWFLKKASNSVGLTIDRTKHSNMQNFAQHSTLFMSHFGCKILVCYIRNYVKSRRCYKKKRLDTRITITIWINIVELKRFEIYCSLKDA